MIITIIVVIILLIAGYFLLRNIRTTSDPAQEGEPRSGNRIFNSLFGTSKKETVLVPVEITETGESTDNALGNTATGNTTGNTTEEGSSNNQQSIGQQSNEQSQGIEGGGGIEGGTGSNSSTGLDSNGNFNTDGMGSDTTGFGQSESISPTLNPLPIPPSTGVGSLGGSSGSGSGSLGTSPGAGTSPGPVSSLAAAAATPSPDICPIDDPLVFTNAEKAELDILLRQYYLIAPAIKGDDDIALLEYDIKTYEPLLNQANSLINQCIVQKSALGYTGPQAIKANPYYPTRIGDPTYLPGQTSPWIQAHPESSISDYAEFELIFGIW